MVRSTGTVVSPDTTELKREFTLWSAFAFAFAFISPIVALYAIFGLGYAAAGPSFWWAFVVVFVAQLFVALVFGELVSRWPIEGSVYQWSSRLIGHGYGWAAGWIYMWVLVNATAVLALFAAQHLSKVFGWNLSNGQTALLAFCVLLVGTGVNVAGRLVLRVLMTASIIGEVIGSVGLGIWLLVAHREHSLTVLTTGFDTANYLTLTGPFVLAVAFVGWSFVGFESAGSIAEEVQDPKRNLPKAIIFALVFIALVVMLSALAVILSIPDDIAANSADPVFDTLTYHLGTGAAKFMEVLITISFLAAFLALQTASSRIIWSYARDHALPGSGLLSKLTQGEKQPVVALLVSMTIATVILLLSTFAPNMFTLLVNFNSGGFFLAFLFPLVGSLVARLRGDWTAGPFSLGRFSTVVSIIAVVCAGLQFVNIAWPRDFYPESPFLNWSVLLAVAALGVTGFFVYRSCRAGMTLQSSDEELEQTHIEPVASTGDSPVTVPANTVNR